MAFERTLTSSGLSINLLLLLVLTHICFPRARRRTSKFFELSYFDSASGTYTQGWDDLDLVAFWIVVFTGLRAAAMDCLLIPFARWGGIQKKKATIRFAEQAWLFLYYAVFWSLGMYIMYNSDYWLNLNEMWTHFPTRSMSGSMKWYYLAQFAFWLQQIVVVNIEERRKDHWQMFTHHIITCALVLTSYGYYQTKVGNVILCVMDVVDLIFPAAKMLKYFGYRTACDIAFGLFMLTWFLARHVVYLLICWSIHVDVPKTMPASCYDSMTGQQISSNGGTEILRNLLQPFINPGGTVCFNERIRYTFLALLLALQVLTWIWFGMICKVAYKVVIGAGADDSRSDDEGEEEEDGSELDTEDLEEQIKDFCEMQPEIQHEPHEEEVDVEDLSYMRRTSTVKVAKKCRKPGSRASGISIPGHTDRKELLGRIGCDKPT
ncbi:Sphingosine N-acyltransferase lag1 [Elasticomyces elasticus]|nr:Sphingosine N-acyltransferase lag1 [Elasticomyces elasticus]KAK4998580.1 Sphingosine N-acyltransferase lag1 [Elasticomyces elasticus]